MTQSHALEPTEDAWVTASDEQHRYELDVVFDRGTPHPRLLRGCDPFGRPVFKDE